ncbi:MAG TPA: proton-conducting transporter membrane subunit [Bryobacteraceae bacterium]|jgi:hydrogenase-4 component B
MSWPIVLLAIFLGLSAAGVVLALLLPDRRNPLALGWTSSLAALCILWLSGAVLLDGSGFQISLWSLPGLGTLTLSLNRLAGFFLFSAGIVFLAASVFSVSYLRRYLGHYSLRSFSVLYHMLFVSVALVLIAGDVLSFLIGWEAMAILSYLLVNYEHEHQENVQAGWLMLSMGEAGTLAAAVAVLVLANSAHSLEFSKLRIASAALEPGISWAAFLLSFFGFGVKAGLVPFSTWLPRAHPVAPANVSAILSGVILNLGIYGIVRVNIDFLPATLVGTGLVTLIVGSASALVGILYATTENDIKTMLAHSSIENMGIIASGLGAGFVFTASKHPALAAIAFAAALYHALNHSVYKALLFLGAGTVDIQTGTRDMDQLGGLIKRLPWTGLFFLVGALAISALPPFNGFASEWLTLQSFLRSVEIQSAAIGTVFAFCGAALALTAGLAITCFVKAFAMTFLGMARSQPAKEVSEAARTMIVPMGALAALCLVFGVAPTYVIPVLDRTLGPYIGSGAEQALVPPFFTPRASELPPNFLSEFHDLGAQVGKGLLPGPGLVVLHRGGDRNPVVFAMSTSYTFIVLLLLLGSSFLIIRLWLTRGRSVVRRLPWDGGLQRLLPAMTYTATGFSSPVSVIFHAVLHPTATEETRETIHEHFRTAIRRQRRDLHILEWLVFKPLASSTAAIANACARMHSGRLNAYVAYVLITLLGILLLR